MLHNGGDEARTPPFSHIVKGAESESSRAAKNQNLDQKSWVNEHASAQGAYLGVARNSEHSMVSGPMQCRNAYQRLSLAVRSPYPEAW